MHSALYIPEVLRNIFFQIKADPEITREDSDSRRSLFAAALTCQSFLDPALDALWFNLPGGLPLIKCMGPDLWDVRDNRLRIIRPIYPRHLELLRRYSARVRMFDDLADLSLFHNQETWATVRAAAGDAILPNLTRLAIHISSPYDFPKLPLLMSPSVKSLSLFRSGTIYRQMQFPSFLANITAEKYPSLANIISDGLNKEENDALCSSLQIMVPITCLEIRQLPHETLKYLSTSKVLCDLRFGIPPLEPFYGSRETSTPIIGTFQALRRVSIVECDNLASTFNFMELLPCNTALTSIIIRTRWTETHSTTAEWSTLFEYFSEKVNPTSLKYIEVRDHGDYDEIAERCPVNAKTFQPLQSFRLLRDLDLYAVQGYDLNDSFLHDFAKGHPELFNLELNPGSPVAPKNTLLGLTSFAMSCPDLDQLSLAFDATQPIPPDYVPAAVQKNLVNLYVNHSPIEDSEKVSKFLLGIFPGLSLVEASVDEGNGLERQDELWSEVSEAVTKNNVGRPLRLL